MKEFFKKYATELKCVAAVILLIPVAFWAIGFLLSILINLFVICLYLAVAAAVIYAVYYVYCKTTNKEPKTNLKFSYEFFKDEEKKN